VDALAGRLGYTFRDPVLLLTAVTHRSFVQERRPSGEPLPYNERLEFLGDAVLDLAVAEALVERLPDAPEGRLSTLRAALVNERSLAAAARALAVGEALRLGKGEDRSGGREKASLLADAFEALVGAVYLDGGWRAARAVARAALGEALERAVAGHVATDHKTALQEQLQRRGAPPPTYLVVGAVGPDHAPRFEVEVTVGGAVVGRGQGRSKKEAEQTAASAALTALEGGADAAKPDDAPDGSTPDGSR
jgi:ribonuclease-3